MMYRGEGGGILNAGKLLHGGYLLITKRLSFQRFLQKRGGLGRKSSVVTPLEESRFEGSLKAL